MELKNRATFQFVVAGYDVNVLFLFTFRFFDIINIGFWTFLNSCLDADGIFLWVKIIVLDISF